MKERNNARGIRTSHGCKEILMVGHQTVGGW